MAKAAKKKPAKKRADHYEEKVKFDGTFEEMVKISTTGAGAKKKIVEQTDNADVTNYIVSYKLFEGNKLLRECNEQISVQNSPEATIEEVIEANIKPNQRIELLSFIEVP